MLLGLLSWYHLLWLHCFRYDTKTGQSPNMPREQQNAMTSWIDGSFVYSTKESWVNAMRSFENGTLTMEGDPTKGMPPLNKMRVPLVNAPAPHLLTKLNPERMYLLGDPRTNQNPAFLVMGILFYRWHNYQENFPKCSKCLFTFSSFTNRRKYKPLQSVDI